MSGNFSDECVFLVGAGISADAGIPISTQLNTDIYESLVRKYSEDSPQRSLFNFIVGAVYFFRGNNNQNPSEMPVNIEEIVSALRKLIRRDGEFISAFVGNWHEKISRFSMADFRQFEDELINLVVNKLDLRDVNKANYLQWFSKIHSKYSSTVNVFTLNHDVALENSLEKIGFHYCTGFDFNPEREMGLWNPSLFDEANTINIHKLHGSLGWLKESDTGQIKSKRAFNLTDSHLMIFGVLEKVTIEEPFFELVRRFKDKSKQASLIVTIGYSFSDPHINSVLFDALRVEKNKKLLIVGRGSKGARDRLEQKYSKQINISLVETFSEKEGAKVLLECNDIDENPLYKKIDALINAISEAPF